MLGDAEQRSVARQVPEARTAGKEKRKRSFVKSTMLRFGNSTARIFRKGEKRVARITGKRVYWVRNVLCPCLFPADPVAQITRSDVCRLEHPSYDSKLTAFHPPENRASFDRTPPSEWGREIHLLGYETLPASDYEPHGFTWLNAHGQTFAE